MSFCGHQSEPFLQNIISDWAVRASWLLFKRVAVTRWSDGWRLYRTTLHLGNLVLISQHGGRHQDTGGRDKWTERDEWYHSVSSEVSLTSILFLSSCLVSRLFGRQSKDKQRSASCEKLAQIECCLQRIVIYRWGGNGKHQNLSELKPAR